MEENSIEGFILLNKPHGVTSFYCVNKIKRILGRGCKVGHAGTLDSFATGLLIIGINRTATRHIKKIMELDKQYTAKGKLGQLTDTLDFTGERLQEEDVSHITFDMVNTAVKSFGKQYKQIPPIYSALKYQGWSLSELARKEKLSSEKLKEIVMKKARVVTLYSLELLDVAIPYFTIKTHVSHGTYIRVLINDIAHKVGTYATTYELERTAIGPFLLQKAVSFKQLKTIEDIQQHSIAIDTMLTCLSDYVLD